MGEGIFDLSTWGYLRIEGSDARDFLHRLTTLDFRPVKTGWIKMGALLTGRAGVIAIGFFECNSSESFSFIAPDFFLSKAQAQLEKMHFSEKLSFHLGTDWKFLALSDCDLPRETLEVTKTNLKDTPIYLWGGPERIPLTWGKLTPEAHKQLLASHGPLKPHEQMRRLFHLYDVPLFEGEIDENRIILEADLEWLLDRDKGCYPGQEVVERIFTYGQVNRKYFSVEINGPVQGLPAPLLTEGRTQAGELISQSKNSKDELGIGLAIVGKKFWTESQFQMENGTSVTLRKKS